MGRHSPPQTLTCSSLCCACPELRFHLSLPQFTSLFRSTNPANSMRHHLSLLSTTRWSRDLTRPLKCGWVTHGPFFRHGQLSRWKRAQSPQPAPQGPGATSVGKGGRVDGTPASVAEALSLICLCRNLSSPACHFSNAASGRRSPLSPGATACYWHKNRHMG